MADPLAFTPIPSGNLAPEREATPGFTPIPPAAAAPAAEPHAGPLSNKPDDNYAMGTLKNVAMTGLETAGGIPGTVGNLREFAQYAADRAHAYLTGKTMPEVVKKREEDDLKERAEQAAWFQKTYGRPMPKLRKSLIEQAPTTEQVISPLTHFTGAYTPTSTEGRYGRTAGVVGLSMLMPGGQTAAARKLASASPALVEPAMSTAAKLRTGAGLGVAQEAATDATGDPLVGAAVIPTIQGGKAVWKGATSVNPQARKLAERDAVDIDKVRKSLEDPSTYELVPGSKPTTAQLTQDEGLKNAQRTAKLADKHFREDLEAQLKTQNAARVEHLQGVAPTDADVLSAPKLFARERQALQQRADQLHNTIATDTDIAGSGESLRARTKAADRELAARTSQLYSTLDPEGRIVAPTPGYRAAADELRSVNPSITEVDPRVTKILEMSKDHPAQMPFRDIFEFEKTITAAMQESGLTPNARRQLGDLKKGLGNDIDRMAENIHAEQQAAVARGTLDPNATWEAALKRQLAEHLEGKQSAGTGARTADGATVGQTGVSGGTGQPGQNRSGPATGATGVPADDAYLAATAQQLKDAKALRTERGETFGREPIAGAIEHNGYDGPKPAGTVAKSAFPGGDNGYADTKAWLTATKNHPQTVADLQDIAMGRLRERMKDGTLTPQQLEAWKAKYGTSLRAIDEAAPGFSNRFNNVAEATRNLHEFDTGTAGKIARAETPSAMRDLVGSLINSADGEAQLANIIPRLRPEDLPGVRRAAINHIMESRGFVSADGTLRGDTLAKHIRDKEGALRKIYGPHFDKLQAVADDLARLQATERQLAVTGSHTEYNRQLVKGLDPQGHPLTAGGLLAIGSLLHHGGPELAAGVGSLLGGWKGYQFLKNWKSTRAEQVYKQALLDPAMMNKLLQPGMLPNGRPNIPALNAVIAMGEGVHEHQRRDEQKRQGRASGGSVGAVDHARHASRMVRMVAKVRDELGRETKPLLNVHDNAIASALANARSMAS